MTCSRPRLLGVLMAASVALGATIFPEVGANSLGEDGGPPAGARRVVARGVPAVAGRGNGNAPRDNKAAAVWPAIRGGVTPAEAAILHQLDEPTKLDLDETPLSDVVEYLKDLHGINIVLDSRGLAALGVTSDVPVTIAIRGVTLRSALWHMLRNINPGLTFAVQNETLLITSSGEAQKLPVERIYDVSALLDIDESAQGLANVLKQHLQLEPDHASAAAGGPRSDRATPQPVAANVGTANEASGDKVGPADDAPPGWNITPYHSSLLVRGTEVQQEAVVRLLRELKAAADAKPGAAGPAADR